MARKELSERERELLAMTEEDIDAATQVFSFDEAEFEERLPEDAEPWDALLIGHLYLEHIVKRLLSDSLPRPKKVKLRSLGFAQMCQLACALGLVSDELAPAVRKVGNLRNKLVHSLDFKVTPKIERDLRTTVPKHLRNHAQNRPSRTTKGKLTFVECLRTLVYWLDIMRQHQARARLQKEKAMARIARAMIRSGPVSPSQK